MDSFEQVVAEILWHDGYWVRTSVKVDLTKDEKKQIGLPSAPRWELDIVAYKPVRNELLVIECKSYLDSPGVRARGFDPTHEASARFKLFNKPELREVVFHRLRAQLSSLGMCAPDAAISLCLACGHIVEQDRAALVARFADAGWRLWDETWLKDRLKAMAARGYENQVSAVVAKLLLRGKLE